MTRREQQLQAIINYINSHVENPNPRLTMGLLKDYKIFNATPSGIAGTELGGCIKCLIEWGTLSSDGLDPSDSMSWSQLYYSIDDSLLWEDWVQTASLFYKKVNLP